MDGGPKYCFVRPMDMLMSVIDRAERFPLASLVCGFMKETRRGSEEFILDLLFW